MEYGLPYVSYDIRAFHRLQGFYRSVNTSRAWANAWPLTVPALLARAFEVDLSPLWVGT